MRWGSTQSNILIGGKQVDTKTSVKFASLSLWESRAVSPVRAPSPAEGTDAKRWSTSDPPASGKVKAGHSTQSLMSTCLNRTGLLSAEQFSAVNPQFTTIANAKCFGSRFGGGNVFAALQEC